MIAPRRKSYFLAILETLSVVILPPYSKNHLRLSTSLPSSLSSSSTSIYSPGLIHPPSWGVIFYSYIYFTFGNIFSTMYLIDLYFFLLLYLVAALYLSCYPNMNYIIHQFRPNCLKVILCHPNQQRNSYRHNLDRLNPPEDRLGSTISFPGVCVCVLGFKKRDGEGGGGVLGGFELGLKVPNSLSTSWA